VAEHFQNRDVIFFREYPGSPFSVFVEALSPTTIFLRRTELSLGHEGQTIIAIDHGFGNATRSQNTGKFKMLYIKFLCLE
jgi:hypothetical protein